MEAMKQFFGTIAAVVGVLSGLVTLYAKYADMKKKAVRDDDGAELPAIPVAVHHHRSPPIDYDEPPVVLSVQESAPASPAYVRQMVKAPAIALMCAGGLSFFLNLATAGFGYVDEFVTPLTTETKARRAAEAARLADSHGPMPYAGAVPLDNSDRTSTVMAVIALFSCSIASAAAAWAGYNMLRMRSYWLSVAGSVAVMPGACLYCFAGLPIGIWSLTVLLKPEVSSSFR